MDLREAAEFALEALSEYEKSYPAVADAFKPLRAALAEPTSQESRQVEPVGYFSINSYGNWEQNESGCGTPLYEAPPKREPLTESFLEELAEKHVTHCYFDTLTYAREIERLHGIGGEE